MPKFYEIPELTLIGQADEVIQGIIGGSADVDGIAADDFEFLQD
ncbi:MAG TPA: hypothetical protein VKG25_04990 [Bryobacteraceae bacterium]|nr:hypothetical protein [Bryobacteraceae bacterium]